MHLPSFSSSKHSEHTQLKSDEYIFIFHPIIGEHFYFFFLSFFSSASSCVFFFASFFFCCLSSCTRRIQFLLKALVHYCFLVFCRTGEYISLALFYIVLSLEIGACPEYSPWYNRPGWLGVKHQFTYLLTAPKIRTISIVILNPFQHPCVPIFF